MDIDLDQRRVSLSVGELAELSFGPRGGSGAAAGLWRAQLGAQWHRRLHAETPQAACEVPIAGEIAHRGWLVGLTGRIDQLVPAADGDTLREIKTVTCPLPAPEELLRAGFPGYFAQIAAYAELRRLAAEPIGRAELVFVEAATGVVQVVGLRPADQGALQRRLDELADFLDARRRARDRLSGLRFKPAFAAPRPGQETIQADLQAAWTDPPRPVLLAAPTGFGKTGVLLEFALGQLRSGRFDRIIYLTSKSTGQLQVVRTLAGMIEGATEGGTAVQGSTGAGVAAWHVRNKAEHCVNPVFHCVREVCPYLDGVEDRWPESGLNRFYLDDGHARDMDSLRSAGRAARVCPYEITRAALAFQQMWIGDYNYVFSPSSRSLFFEQPGFDPGRSLLLVDEAHNLPSRAADAHSHAFTAAQADEVAAALRSSRAPGKVVVGWDAWARFLHALQPADSLSADEQAEAQELVGYLADLGATEPVDHARLGPRAGEALWEMPSLASELEESDLPRLWWCPKPGQLALTCLDAAADIGARLREFGGTILATATPGPLEALAASLGLERPAPPPPKLSDAENSPQRLGSLGARQTRKLLASLSTGAGLLRAQQARAPALVRIEAHAPWRERAYDVAVDLRVDTTFQQRSRYYGLTAGTIARFQEAAGGPVAVFFSSYLYAERVLAALEALGPRFSAAMQPRQPDLALQAAWVEESLAGAGALFLILGSSFAESIDLLGGRVGKAVVVGPSLPEVNAVQHAKFAAHCALGREAAFDRTYRIPGMQKVSQALGRLVRAPGQRARVLLHCRRFAEPAYANLLAPEYRSPRRILSDEELDAWIDSGPPGEST